MGDVEDGYKATVVLRVMDVFGDYEEIRFGVIVSAFIVLCNLDRNARP